MLVAMLVHIDGPNARAMYDKLRAAYNSTRRPGDLLIPPLEDWQGGSAYCDQFFCRFAPPRVATPL